MRRSLDILIFINKNQFTGISEIKPNSFFKSQINPEINSIGLPGNKTNLN